MAFSLFGSRKTEYILTSNVELNLWAKPASSPGCSHQLSPADGFLESWESLLVTDPRGPAAPGGRNTTSLSVRTLGRVSRAFGLYFLEFPDK